MPHSIAQVVVGLAVHGPFDYVIPPNLLEDTRVGSRVYVSFGSKFCVGYVVGLLQKSRFPRLKPIVQLLDNIPTMDEKFLKLANEFSQYYACSLGQAIEAALPVILRGKKQIVWTPPAKVENPNKPQTLFCQGSLQASACVVAKKIKSVLEEGRGVIFLVPEAGQLRVAQEFLEKVALCKVSVLDRSGGVKEQLAQWLAVKEGNVRVVCATRSAVFAMMPNLGLIVIVDEENPAYKQEPSPFYHAREIAFWRQKYESCDLLFVTPTPTAELWKILKEKKADWQVCEEKHSGALQVIDLANYKYQNMLLSFPLQNTITETFLRGQKVLLFLNRRGFSTLTKCNQCGFVLRCERCETILNFMYSKKKMVCHRCGLSSDLPKICPQCQGSYLRSMGVGIEKLESDLARIYPQALIATFDSGSKTFSNDAHLMIATSAVMPFLHRAHFSLIAVLDFDGEINRIDFRAASRAFSLLVRLRQAAKEKLIVQTRNLRHPAIISASSINAEEFYRSELKTRRELKLPPYAQIIALSLRSISEEQVSAQAVKLYQQIASLADKDFEIALPQPDLIPKLRDKYRYTIMLKGKTVKSMLKAVEQVLGDFHKHKDVILTIDVNP